ncbi:hypothetical protein [Phreatobacter sp. AB_2022a]|uniref:hypothetical protein n=1 Tax=Phreatobacter sp. AB_2022a TaxID=3003134 RepID=UPI0022873415|nr:hypothetical protein [Phreatobacter sp. AB_2022a]MCZ0733247.1 hypothetical protein [Phreatobacter sp. AB_2022a]
MNTPALAPRQDAEALLLEIIALSPYRRVLGPLQADITRIALGNKQVSAALAAVIRRSGFTAGAALRRQDLGAEARTFAAFLEHVHFASPPFLETVGEWPLGVRRGE